MSRPKDVKNAKFCAESNGCVGSFWNGLNGVSISAVLVFLYLIVYCPALMPRRTLSPIQYGRDPIRILCLYGVISSTSWIFWTARLSYQLSNQAHATTCELFHTHIIYHILFILSHGGGSIQLVVHSTYLWYRTLTNIILPPIRVKVKYCMSMKFQVG